VSERGREVTKEEKESKKPAQSGARNKITESNLNVALCTRAAIDNSTRVKCHP
jgi:hypothetical protein